MCRFLFRRCDPEPAPWVSGDTGDGAWEDLPAEALEEIQGCKEKVHKAGENAFWDWDAEKATWGWMKAPPLEASTPGKAPASGKSLLDQLRKKVNQVRVRCMHSACVHATAHVLNVTSQPHSKVPSKCLVTVLPSRAWLVAGTSKVDRNQ
jgi:hypothetical protein